jgi:hypothetical protein
MFFYGTQFFFGLYLHYALTSDNFWNNGIQIEEGFLAVISTGAAFTYIAPYFSQSVRESMNMKRKNITLFMTVLAITGYLTGIVIKHLN